MNTKKIDSENKNNFNTMSHADYLLLSLKEKTDNRYRAVNVKGFIIVSELDNYRTYDCIISIPSLKIQLKEDVFKELINIHKKAQYINVLCMLVGNPVEVSIYLKDNKAFYANAREISKLNLEKMPFLKENTLIKKYLKDFDGNMEVKKNNKKN